MTMALLVQAAGAAGVTAALAGMSQYFVNRRELRRTRHLDSYGYVCGRPGQRRTATMGCIVDETDQGPIHAAPNGRALCCDQALVCWPHPCPWIDQHEADARIGPWKVTDRVGQVHYIEAHQDRDGSWRTMITQDGHGHAWGICSTIR